MDVHIIIPFHCVDKNFDYHIIVTPVLGVVMELLYLSLELCEINFDSIYFQELPFDMSLCVFVLDQALSVRALQEMVSARTKDTVGF